MPTKDQLNQQYTQTTHKITSTYENWCDFLVTVGKLHKYSFSDQVLIHEQRPQAVACADYNIWNNKMNRYIKKGATGIALIDDSQNDVDKVKYVFDLADTGVKRNSRTPYLWQYQNEDEIAVLEGFNKRYNLDEISIERAVDKIANELAMSYYVNVKSDMQYFAQDSRLEDFDIDNIETSFLNASTSSISFAVLSRMNFDTERYFSHEEFLSVFDFNTETTLSLLGSSISESSNEILKEITRIILNIERSKEHEHDLQTRGRLPNSEPHNQDLRLSTEQVRTNEKSVLEEQQESNVQSYVIDGETSTTLDRNRQSSEREITTLDEPTPQNPTSTRQNETTNAVGSTYEQPQSTSRGDNHDGANLQLNFDNQEIITGEQVSLFPTEEKQIKTITDRQTAKAERQSVISLSSRISADKLAHYMEDFLNGLDTKYAGTITADFPEIKRWDHLGKSKNKKKHLTITLHSPVTDMSDNAFTYFNKGDTSDEVTMNDVIFLSYVASLPLAKL